MKYIEGYPEAIINKVRRLIDENKLGDYLLTRYPEVHSYRSDKELYKYSMSLKGQFLKQSPPLSKVIYDDKIHLYKHALGTHTSVSRVQGNKLKNKKEIRIAGLFRLCPEPFLKMIVAHELAHIREADHNRAFYKLCQYIEPNYHQLELDTRLYLIQLEYCAPIYELQ